MIRLKCLVSILFFVSITAGEISTTVFLSDGNTPLALVDPNIPHLYQDIMVGTKLTIIVSSDTNDNYWPCDLAIRGANRDYGVLSARDFNESTGYYDGSLLEAAGDNAYVYLWHDDDLEIDGFSFTGEGDAGNWFVIDYNAIGIGDCNVGFYEWLATEPTYEISFSHVRTRDFNNDTTVNFTDFAIFASYWLATNCTSPACCQGTDLDTNGSVNVNDLMLFCQYWLERTK